MKKCEHAKLVPYVWWTCERPAQLLSLPNGDEWFLCEHHANIECERVLHNMFVEINKEIKA